MKLLVVFSLSLWMLAAADAQSRNAPPAATGVAASSGIPAAAVKGSDGAFRYTDPQGKKWVYRKTPFGVARAEDKPAETPAESTQRFDNVKATEDGDSIRFERPGPFGIYRWQRKKTELNEMEQTVWNREQSRAAASKD
jgi:hypothetical protein